jgi:hypothetical protein
VLFGRVPHFEEPAPDGWAGPDGTEKRERPHERLLGALGRQLPGSFGHEAYYARVEDEMGAIPTVPCFLSTTLS